MNTYTLIIPVAVLTSGELKQPESPEHPLLTKAMAAGHHILSAQQLVHASRLYWMLLMYQQDPEQERLRRIRMRAGH